MGTVNDGVDWYELKKCFGDSVLFRWWIMYGSSFFNRELSVCFAQCGSLPWYPPSKNISMQRPGDKTIWGFSFCPAFLLKKMMDCYAFESGKNVGNFVFLSTIRVFL